MTRYVYRKDRRHRFRHRLYDRNFASQIGWVWRKADSRTWFAEIFSDPLIIGKGRTRDAAVDKAYEMVGGPG